MKKVGLVGGISWVSTTDYYKFINEGVNARLGGLNFAQCLIHSLNFADVQAKGWNDSFDLLQNACDSLKRAGADSIALCANTAHLYVERLEESVNLPIIDVRIETAKALKNKGIKKAGLLGTKFTMEQEFYRKKFEEYGIEIIIPEKQEVRDYIHYTVKEELGVGLINPDTKTNYISIVHKLIDKGVECVILGCTEIPLLISQDDFAIPIFDTTKIHSQSIVNYMLS